MHWEIPLGNVWCSGCQMHGHTSGLQSGTQTHLTEIGQTLLSVSYTDLSKTPGEVLMGGGGGGGSLETISP